MKRSPVDSGSFSEHGASRTLSSSCRILVKLALLVPMLSPAAAVPAQEANAALQVHRVAPRYKRQSLDERVELLARHLDLNGGQKSTLKIILLERQQDILNMRHAPSHGDGLQLDRFRTIEDKTAERIRAMLTEEQRKKYDPLGVRNSNFGAQNVRVEDWLKVAGPR
jgi:hypothetical protein